MCQQKDYPGYYNSVSAGNSGDLPRGISDNMEAARALARLSVKNRQTAGGSPAKRGADFTGRGT
ncbi:hypothetical protein FACS189499_05900 [Clostridia bacterium]|nr:hypothetical protein FACS189499_05900 [Clostridia bacterium]